MCIQYRLTQLFYFNFLLATGFRLNDHLQAPIIHINST